MTETNGGGPASDHEATAPTASAELPGAPDAPDNGIIAGKKLMEYAEALAVYCEETGDFILTQAQSFHAECKMLAANYRESAKIEADRAVNFTVTMRDAAGDIQKLRSKFINGTVAEGQQ